MNDLLATIRAAHPDKFVPALDPNDGGLNADVLILLEAPGPKATKYVSRDNPDPTARNLKAAFEVANIPRARTCLWNVVPFYIGREDRSRIRAAKKSDIEVGAPYVMHLIAMMPKLHSVVLLGRKAQRVECYIGAKHPELRIFKSWHPSGQSLNPVPERRGELIEALRMAAL